MPEVIKNNTSNATSPESFALVKKMPPALIIEASSSAQDQKTKGEVVPDKNLFAQIRPGQSVDANAAWGGFGAKEALFT